MRSRLSLLSSVASTRVPSGSPLHASPIDFGLFPFRAAIADLAKAIGGGETGDFSRVVRSPTTAPGNGTGNGSREDGLLTSPGRAVRLKMAAK